MTDEPTYQIKDWSKLFEGPKSKAYHHKSSTQMPNKFGLGYKRIIRAKDGAAMYGAWCALVHVLSRQDCPRDGYVTDDGKKDSRPMSPDDLEIHTDIPAKYFRAVFDAAQSVDWVDVIDSRIPQGYHGDTTGSARGPLDSDSDVDSDKDKDKDIKPKKTPFGEFGNVNLTCGELEKLRKEHGDERVKAGIEYLDDYMESKGKQKAYKSHYAVLKKTGWVWDKVPATVGNRDTRINKI